MIPKPLRRVLKPLVARCVPGFAMERLFWRWHFRRPEFLAAQAAEREPRFPADFLPAFEELKRRCAPARLPRVLDVGSGPLSRLAWGCDRELFALEAVDPLAETYARLLARAGVDFPVVPRRGFAETLGEDLPLGAYDAVCAFNALDHMRHPRVALLNMTLLLRPGGMLLFSFYEREGTREGFVGLHRHDLFFDAGRLLFQTREGAPREFLADFPLVEAEVRTARDRDRLLVHARYVREPIP